MRTYRTQPRQNLSGPGAPARVALVLFFLALIGGLLVALTPTPSARRMMTPGPSGLGSSRPRPPVTFVLLSLTLPKPATALPLDLAAAPVIDETPIAEPPSRPSREPMPPVPVAAVFPQAAPRAVVGTIPAVVAEAIPEPPPVADPEAEIAIAAVGGPQAAPDLVADAPSPLAAEPPAEAAPAMETMTRTILVAALPIFADDEEPVPYAAGALAPDEAAAMPGDEPPASVAEETPQVAAPLTANATVAPVVPPLPGTPADKASPDPVLLAFARPSHETTDWPRIAVVVAGLGLGRAATSAAIKLPGAVTLAFASHARDLQQWIDVARAAGHEVLLDLPMEPENYPAIDPGPQALLTSLSDAENAERLNWHLGRATGYVGVTQNMGSRFTASSDHMRPILSALKVRGLMFLDARTSADSVAASLATTIGLPRAINNRFLDTQASRPAIDRRLGEIERITRGVGFSVAVGHPYPVTIERLERWIETLDGKKLVLVPVSALVNRQAVE